jgi:hypothetical protein
MSKTTIIAIVLLTFGIIGGIGLGVLRLSNSRESQNIASSASSGDEFSTPSSIPAIVNNVTAQTCTTPAQVSNVEVSYPSCVGAQCSFVEADCTWEAVSGAANYSVKVTEVDSGSVIKNVTVGGSSVSYTFPVTQGKTYRCDIAAVNSCGTSGPTGSAEAVCEVDGLTVSTAPSATPTPTPTPTPKPSPLACGMSCTTTTDCQTGFICLKLPTGTGYCANPSYQQSCMESPSINSCCKAPPKPTPPPELPKSGLLDNTVTIGVVGFLLVGMAAAMMIIK